jgi:hypothetical protein
MVDMPWPMMDRTTASPPLISGIILISGLRNPNGRLVVTRTGHRPTA